MTRRQFSTRLRRQKKFRQKTLNNIVLFVIAMMPIYPAFGSYMQDYTGAIVRGQYDKSTIIDAYDATTGVDTTDASGGDVADTSGSDGSAETDTTNTDTADTTATPPIPEPPTPVEVKKPVVVDRKQSLYVVHTVVRGDTLSTIAEKYGVTAASIRTTNSLTHDRLAINQKLTIPHINGVQYVVQKGDTLSSVGQKYGVDTSALVLANDLKPGSWLILWKQLLVPNPTKDPTKRIIAVVPKVVPPVPAKATTPVARVVRRNTPNADIITYDNYSLTLKVKNGCRNFVWGNCTCFVAKYKNVTWHGNAKDWLKNAERAGVPTGSTPKAGAIIVYHGPGFPPAYGHVGIVMEVNEDGMIIKDMNYRALNEITTRRETFDNPAIRGYIYVD